MMYDVIVIGAGPGGLSAALHSANLGLTVLVIEKNKEIGYPMKTSAMTWNETAKLLNLSEESLGQRIDSVYFHNHHNGDSFEKKFSRPIGFVLNYHVFLRELAQKAIDAGAEIVLNEMVVSEVRKNGVLGVKTSKNEFLSKIVIDCSGPEAVLGKRLRPSGFSKAELGVGAEMEMWGIELPNENRIEFHVGRDEVVPVGYGWVFPTGKNCARVGLATVLNAKEEVKNFNVESLLNRFIDKKKSPIKNLLKHAQPIEMHYGAYHLTTPIRSYSDNLLLVGDSASQASAMLGEGIRYATVFGKYAAEVSSKSIEEDDLKSDRLSEYQSLCNSYLLDHFEVAQEFLLPDTNEYWTKIVKNLKKHPDLCLSYLKTELDKNSAKKLME